MTDAEIKKDLLFVAHYCHDEYNEIRVDVLLLNALDLINRQKAEIERLTAFKSYFDELYGEGLDIANWHKNGDLEPFDSFYDSALEEMSGEG